MSDTKKFQEKLESEKKILLGELGQLGRMDKQTGDWESTPEEPGATEADPNDAADRFEGFEERSSTLNSLEGRLREVDIALEKIKTGKYGLCVICQNLIENKRLDVNPAAQTCLKHLETKS